MKTFISFALLITSALTFAADKNALCGVNTPRGEQIRLLVALHQADDFDRVHIGAINGSAPRSEDERGAHGFGPHGYENLSITFTDGCNGTATYNHYDASMPMNPMTSLTLKCICK